MAPQSLALVWWEDLALVSTETWRKALPCAFQQKLSSAPFLLRVSVTLNIFNDYEAGIQVGVQFSGRLARRQEMLGSNHSIKCQESGVGEGRKDKSVYYPRIEQCITQRREISSRALTTGTFPGYLVSRVSENLQ